MEITIIGTGQMARGVATRALAGRHSVTLVGRTASKAEALEINPAPGKSFPERERRRTELTVAFHYADPLARVILKNLHLDAAVAAMEAAHIDSMVDLAAGVMNIGQWRGEIPEDRDSRFIGAMIIGGMRRVLAVALSTDPPIPQEETARKLWVLNAGIMGVDPGLVGTA